MVSDFRMIFIRQIYKRYKIFREYLSFCFCCRWWRAACCITAAATASVWVPFFRRSTPIPLHSTRLVWAGDALDEARVPLRVIMLPNPNRHHKLLHAEAVWKLINKLNDDLLLHLLSLELVLGEHTRKSYFRAELWPTTQNCFHAVARRVTCCPRWV